MSFPGPLITISVARYWSPNACLPITIGFVQPGTNLGTLFAIIGCLNTVPPRIFLIVPLGDLYIFLSIKDHPIFKRDGANIYCRVPLAMSTATLGGQIEVPTLGGGRARISIKPGTQSGTQFRLRGKGMSILRRQEVNLRKPRLAPNAWSVA